MGCTVQFGERVGAGGTGGGRKMRGGWKKKGELTGASCQSNCFKARLIGRAGDELAQWAMSVAGWRRSSE